MHLKSDPLQPGLGRWSSRVWLLLILGAAAWIRLKACQHPSPCYWWDFGVSMLDGRCALDYPGEQPLIFKSGNRQPFYQYVVVAAYWLFPKAPSVLIQNVSWAVMDLFALWIHYLLGKEVGGRRTGLLLAGCMAFSKPVLVNSLTVQSTVTTPLGVGLILLFTFRFLRKMDMRHALQWGIAVAFGAYCYTAVRPYLWIAPMLVLAAALWRTRARREIALWIFGGGLALLWTYAFFRINHFLKPLPLGGPLSGDGWVLSSALVLIAAFAFKYMGRKESAPEIHPLSSALVGCLAAAALAAPIVTHPLFADWSSRWSIFWPQHPMLPPGGLTFGFVALRFVDSFRGLFVELGDRSDMWIPGEAVFDLFGAALLLVGLAWALARRGWRNVFLLSCILFASVPTALAFLPHTGRYLGLVTPWFLLASLGLDDLLGSLRRLPVNRAWIRIVAVAALVLYGFLAFKAMDHRFYTLLPRHMVGQNVLIFEQARQDSSHARLYFIKDGMDSTDYDMSVLVDGYFDLFLLTPGEGEAVPAEKGLTAPDVALYFGRSQENIFRRVKRDFPNARFEETRHPTESAGTPGFLTRAYIAGKDIAPLRDAKNPPLFYRVDKKPRAWRRRFYPIHFGLGHGVISKEDWVTDPMSRLPIGNVSNSAVVEGRIRIPRSGKVLFTVKTPNIAVLTVGGRKVLDLRDERGRPTGPTRSVRLEAGEYDVRLVTFFRNSLEIPPVMVVLPGETEERPLGSLSP